MNFCNHFTARTLVELRCGMSAKKKEEDGVRATGRKSSADLGEILKAAGAVLAREHAVEKRCDALVVKHADEVDKLFLGLADDDDGGERVQAELYGEVAAQ